jgi:tetratricopeptide (TPR) repeat protein
VSFKVQLAAARSGRADPDALAELARAAVREGEEERALPLLASSARRSGNPRLWQWTGLLQRALDQHEAALNSFAEAARLAPADPSIAHGRARVALEAGLDAVALFEQAWRLAPSEGDVLIGRAAAQMATGRGEQAATELDGILAHAPLWLQGHQQLAQLRSTLGRADQASASLERALDALPEEAELWRGLFDLHIGREDYERLGESLERAKAAPVWEALRGYEAIAVSELGDAERADALFQAAPAAARPPLGIWHIRHLLRTGRARDALALIDEELQSERAALIWPYAATAWRLTGDPRGEWLQSDPRLIAVTDLGRELPPLARIAALLRSLHVAKGEYLDQSVRGGTQTDGPLFSRIEPEIRATREAIVRAVGRYLGQLPPIAAGHPLLGLRRDRRARFAGSWSVRLRGAGHHSNHVHVQGWISSALYISLPARQQAEHPHAGWLTVGQPPAQLRLDLPPTRSIEPKGGQLVLFPSWMWHGTRPFAEGERLTVAFDVAPPR